jgi:hypothetical protein
MIEPAPIEERKELLLQWRDAFQNTKYGSMERLELFRQLKNLKNDSNTMLRYPELAQIPSYQEVYKQQKPVVKLSDQDMEFYRIKFRCDEKTSREERKKKRRKYIICLIQDFIIIVIGVGIGWLINLSFPQIYIKAILWVYNQF